MGSHPDADLHASATGPAAKIVEVRSSSHNNIIVNETLTARQSKAHQKEEPLKLYSGWLYVKNNIISVSRLSSPTTSCPFVQRAWTVLEEKSPSLPPLTTPTYPSKLTPEIPYQYIEVNPYNKPQSLLSLNPRGLVPTLQYENKPLYESTVICEFLEEAYPDHTPHLLPKDPYDRARTRIWTDFCTSRIIPAFHRFLQFQPMSDEEGLEEARKEFLGKWMVFAKEMDESGPFFLGREPSLVDFVVAPWAVRTSTLLRSSVMIVVADAVDLASPMGLRPLQGWSRTARRREGWR